MARNNIQRALVLQGGGSLGAYEAGVFNALYYWIRKENDSSRENDNIFDVIAGTSIGAINCCIFGKSCNKKEERRKQEC